MKELSIEQKAQAYDGVREKIAIRFGSNVADEIFSQFEMSEDERIRKELIEFVKSRGGFKQEYIAWLEKQGEQKPAWSEEDEEIIINIGEYLNRYGNYIAESNEEKAADVYKSADWLKSLKERYTWKPSDEQIQALEYQVHSTFEGSWQYKASKELLEQLKKL